MGFCCSIVLGPTTSGSTGYPQWGLSWTYDRYGNRTAQSRTYGTTAPTDSPTISTSTNRITALNSTNFTYDSNGNLTLDDLCKYKYDAENRMVELRYPNDTLIASYAFDGNSLRVVKVWGADRTFYIYAGTKVIGEFEDAASNTYSAGTTPGQAGSDSTSTMLYQHADRLTTRVTTDNVGNLSNEQAHYPYGEQWFWGGTADPSVERKFTTYQREDEATTGKLNYAVYREQSARIGRFLMADPKRGNVRNPQRLNRYAYVTGNPVMRTDRQGLDDSSELPGGDNWVAIISDLGNGGGIANAFGNVGGWIGAREGWLAQQNAAANLMNTIPVGCWYGSGYRNEACVRAQNGGSGGIGGGLPGSLDLLNVMNAYSQTCEEKLTRCMDNEVNRLVSCLGDAGRAGFAVAVPCIVGCAMSGGGFFACSAGCISLGGLSGLGWGTYCLTRFDFYGAGCFADYVPCAFRESTWR